MEIKKVKITVIGKNRVKFSVTKKVGLRKVKETEILRDLSEAVTRLEEILDNI